MSRGDHEDSRQDRGGHAGAQGQYIDHMTPGKAAEDMRLHREATKAIRMLRGTGGTRGIPLRPQRIGGRPERL